MRTQEPLDLLSRYVGYQGFAVTDVRFEEDRAGQRVKVVSIEDRRKTCVCPTCGKRRPPAFRETEPIWLRDASIGDFVTYLEIRPARVRCCGGTPVERLPIRAGRRRMSVRFFERIAALARCLPIDEVARLAQLSWDTVARVDEEATKLALGGTEPEIPKNLRAIGIDEVSRTGGHVYFTIVTDLKRGKVLFVGDGKGEAGLLPFVEKLGKNGKKRIRVVVADLGYRTAIANHFLHAKYLLDRFHIVKWINEALNAIRRRVFGGAPRTTTGRKFKIKKWLLLRGGERLERKHKIELNRLLELNRPLYKAYVLKEQFREILRYPWKNLKALERRLRRWCNMMSWSKVPELLPIARRIRDSIARIVARYEHLDLPMGLVEALNGIIGNLRRKARGFRKVESYKLKIYQRLSLDVDPWRDIVL